MIVSVPHFEDTHRCTGSTAAVKSGGSQKAEQSADPVSTRVPVKCIMLEQHHEGHDFWDLVV
jgi:hypothetical protein